LSLQIILATEAHLAGQTLLEEQILTIEKFLIYREEMMITTTTMLMMMIMVMIQFLIVYVPSQQLQGHYKYSTV
jgi:hypothetical protein